VHQPIALSVIVRSSAPGRMPKKPAPAYVATVGSATAVRLPWRSIIVGVEKRLPSRKRLGGRPSSLRSRLERLNRSSCQPLPRERSCARWRCLSSASAEGAMRYGSILTFWAARASAAAGDASARTATRAVTVPAKRRTVMGGTSGFPLRSGFPT
jgi:hypothetical protein